MESMTTKSRPLECKTMEIPCLTMAQIATAESGSCMAPRADRKSGNVVYNAERPTIELPCITMADLVAAGF